MKTYDVVDRNHRLYQIIDVEMESNENGLEDVKFILPNEHYIICEMPFNPRTFEYIRELKTKTHYVLTYRSHRGWKYKEVVSLQHLGKVLFYTRWLKDKFKNCGKEVNA